MNSLRTPSPFARARPLMLARAAAALITVVIPLVLARSLAPADYGAYKQLVLVSQTLFFVLPLGMAQSLYYFLPRAAAPRRYLVQSFLFLSATGLIALLALWLGGPAIARILNSPGLAPLMPALGVYTFALIASTPLEIALTARGRTGAAALLYVGSDALKALAMTLPVALGRGLSGLTVGLVVFAAVRLLSTLALRSGEAGAAFDRRTLGEQLRYALPFGAAVALAVPQQSFHQYVVSSGLDSARFAVYAVGLFQVPVFDLLYTPTSEVLMVRLAELDGQTAQAAAVFRATVVRLAQIFLPMTALLVALAPELVAALFTSRYLAAVPVFQLSTLANPLGILPLDGALRARGHTRHILLSNLVKAIATVPLVLWGVARFGMLGGVGSWLAAQIVGKAVMLAGLPRAMGATMGELLPGRELVRPALAALGAASAVLAVRALVGAHLRPLFTGALASLAYGGLYLGLLAGMGETLSAPTRWIGRGGRATHS